MSESESKPESKSVERPLRYQVGDIVKIGEIEYKVIGTDNSDKHPSQRVWHYWLRAEKDARDEFRLTEDKLEKLMAGNTEDEKG